MIISRTPFRVSLFGGGTDYPTWFREHGGAVLGTTIDKYCYISIRHLPPFFDYRHRLVYSKVETVSEFEDIKHPAIRGILQDRGNPKGLEIHHDGDLPARSGLGSSSSFVVGLVNALRALDGKMSSSHFLGNEGIRIEQDVLAENVGSQDQLWAAYGGTNRIEFFPDSTFSVSPVIMSRKRRSDLNSHLMMFFTGFTRIASEVAKQKIDNLHQRELQLFAMRKMVDEAQDVLESEARDICDIGRMLHESWSLKRELADSVTTTDVDAIYEVGRAAGALGGKLLGAGGGGFIIFFAKPENQAAISKALSNLVQVKFSIGSPGSTITVYEPDLDN